MKSTPKLGAYAFSVSKAASPSKFAPPFNDSRQSLKGLNGAGQSLVLGAITGDAIYLSDG